MQLSADFPHSRHEQYVLALPFELRSRAERLEAMAVLHRGLLFYTALREKNVAELTNRGWSEEDIERALLRRGLAADFFPADGEPWLDDS